MANEQGELFETTNEEMFQQALASEPAPEQEAPPEPPQPETPPPPPEQPTEGAIPSWRLREEAEARRLAEDRARTLEARLQQIEAYQQQARARQQQQGPDFFENPQAATARIAQDVVTRMVQPLAMQYRQQLMDHSRDIAAARHGEDKVDAAEAAFMEAKNRGTLDPADFERVVGANNRFTAVVQWHKRQSVLSSVGDDPEAWFEKQFESRMSDPTFQSRVLERVRGSASSRPSTTKLPPSLSNATAAASNLADVGDMSHDSLFEFTTRR